MIEFIRNYTKNADISTQRQGVAVLNIQSKRAKSSLFRRRFITH